MYVCMYVIVCQVIRCVSVSVCVWLRCRQEVECLMVQNVDKVIKAKQRGGRGGGAVSWCRSGPQAAEEASCFPCTS